MGWYILKIGLLEIVNHGNSYIETEEETKSMKIIMHRILEDKKENDTKQEKEAIKNFWSNCF